MTIITLLTDFGYQDEFVGVMKGVMLSRYPQAQLVDLTHAIEPQDIVQGAYLLRSAASYFPAGSIHLAVVDPGVGGTRTAVAVRQDGHSYVAPNNGILSLVVESGVDRVVSIENRDIFKHPVSATFHGRDIFAPAAAHLAAGNRMEELGPVMSHLDLIQVQPEIPVRCRTDKIEGCVVLIDSFGNLMTNISSRTLENVGVLHCNHQVGIRIGATFIPMISSTYSSVEKQTPLALIGSRNYLEISVNMGNAAKQLGACKGDRVVVTFAGK